MGRLEAESSWKSKQQPQTAIHGNMSESSSRGEEEPPEDGEERDLTLDRAGDAGLQAWGQGSREETAVNGALPCCHFGEPTQFLLLQTC